MKCFPTQLKGEILESFVLVIEGNDFKDYSIDDILMTAPSSYAVAGGKNADILHLNSKTSGDKDLLLPSVNNHVLPLIEL